MELKVKKEIFLRIIEELFADDTKEIDKGNCVSFCNFLIDTLDLELEAIPEEEEADRVVLESILELVSNLDTLNVDISFWNSKQIKEYLLDYSGLEEEDFQFSLYKFRKIYSFIKNDFILGLP